MVKYTCVFFLSLKMGENYFYFILFLKIVFREPWPNNVKILK